MKKIYESVPLATVLYLIGGLQNIKIVDYKNSYQAMERGDGKVVFEGLFKDAPIFSNRQDHAKVRGIDANGDQIRIAISTEADQYDL